MHTSYVTFKLSSVVLQGFYYVTEGWLNLKYNISAGIIEKLYTLLTLLNDTPYCFIIRSFHRPHESLASMSSRIIVTLSIACLMVKNKQSLNLDLKHS